MTQKKKHYKDSKVSQEKDKVTKMTVTFKNDSKQSAVHVRPFSVKTDASVEEKDNDTSKNFKQRKVDKALSIEKEHYKMYKDGKHWVAAKVATAATIALFSTAILGTIGGGKVNADNVNPANASPTATLTATASSDNKAETTSTQSDTTKTDTNANVSAQAEKTANTDTKTADNSNNQQVSSTKAQSNVATTDTKTAATASSTAQQSSSSTKQTKSTDSSNGGNSTTTQSQGTDNGIKVDVPHQDLTNAVDKAEQTGVDVTQDPTQHQTTTADKSNEVQDQIKNDYANQTSQIEDATKKQEAVNAAKDTANDHSKLDQAVNDAKNNGVNVVKDNDKTVSGSTDDANKVKDEVNKDYQSQIDEINKANEDYKAALDKYNEEMKKYDNTGLAMNGVDSATIKQELQLNKSPNATISFEKLTNDASFTIGKPSYSSSGCDSKQALVIVANSKNGISGDIAKLTYDNINGSYKGKKISKIVATYSNLQAGTGITHTDNYDNSNGNPYLRIYSDPTDGFWYMNSNGVTVTYQYYDENGNLIILDDSDAYMTVGSLNNSNGSTTSKEHLEEATLDSAGKAIALKGSSVSAHDKTLYSDKNNDANQKEWDVTGSDKAYYGSGVFALSGSSVKMTFSTKNQDSQNPTVWVQMSTTIPQTPEKPEAPTVHYHYDVADVPNAKASYHLTDLSVTPQNHKDVEAGTVTGDTSASINNGTVVAGDKLTFPCTNSNLPANRVDDMKEYVIVDNLDKDVKYTGYKAELDGKDVSDQFIPTLSKNSDGTWTVKLTAKQSLLDQMNADKSKEFVVPTVDIYGEALNDNSEIDNSIQTIINGHTIQSNTVKVHTPAMNPTKDVVQDVGNQTSINNKNLTVGQYYKYELNSSERPANYDGTTSEWGGTDKLDTEHIEFTGNWQVFADHDFQLADGTVVKKGTDITKYFTMNYNNETGEFSLEANKDFLDIMNLPVNKKTAQGWTAFIYCKAIKDGEVLNTWTETMNGKVRKSNTVKNQIVSPKKTTTTTTPSTPTPQKEVTKTVTKTVTVPQKETPQTVTVKKEESATPAPQEQAVSPQPVLATVAPVKESAPVQTEKQAMPQTGEKENNEAALIGLTMLGVVGSMALGMRRKKRY